MNRWLGVFGVMFLAATSTGCLRHQTRGNCNSGCSTAACGPSDCSATCSTGACGGGDCGTCNNGCNDCNGGRVGVLNRLRGNACGAGCRNGCVAGPLGWQQGGLNYGSHLQPGLLGHGAGAQLNSTPFTPGPPTGQVAYPYYSVRGPRDFFVDNPPTIGR